MIEVEVGFGQVELEEVLSPGEVQRTGRLLEAAALFEEVGDVFARMGAELVGVAQGADGGASWRNCAALTSRSVPNACTAALAPVRGSAPARASETAMSASQNQSVISLAASRKASGERFFRKVRKSGTLFARQAM